MISSSISSLIQITNILSKTIDNAFKSQLPFDVHEKGESNFVTSIDITVEEIIISSLKKSNPEYAFLSEEAGGITTKDKDYYRWIIDPIDGTFNFLHKNPLFGVSIALEKVENGNSEVVLGFIYLPFFNEIFYAEKGQGAYVLSSTGTKKINVSDITSFCKLLVGTGENLSYQKQNIINQINKKYEQVRISGSAAVDFCFLASGRYDLIILDGLKIWDVAAGFLIIKEAGGAIKNFDGINASIHDQDFIACNPNLLSKLIL